MKILVTGGGGYIGCKLVPLLLSEGHEVRVFDRFCFGEGPLTEALKPVARADHCDVVHGDIRRFQECTNLLDGIDTVIHMAGLANDPSCEHVPDMAMDVNFESTRELAMLAQQHGVHRFVLVSSCSVYGKGVFDILDEDSPVNPVSTYGSSKSASEKALLESAPHFFETVVARPGTCYGWSPRMRFDLAINQMTATAVRKGVIRVFGGGEQWRPFVHVEDAARALLMLAEAPAGVVSGQIFNIGSNDANFRIVDLAARVSELLGGVPVEQAASDVDVRSHRILFDKLASRLGFECAHTPADGVAEVKQAIAERGLDPFAPAYFNFQRLCELLATPVDEGGEPVVAHFLPLARPSLDAGEENAVVEVLRSGWLTTGARTHAFEKSMADKVGAAECVAVSSCTAALHLCLAELGVRPGDQVITSPLTWPSTANTVVNMGAELVLADIDPATLNIASGAIEKVVTERTRVVMPVHLAGLPCDLEEVYAVARRHGLGVVEDAAHALGARYRGTPIGSYGDFACFSFYPIKNITTIDGGVIAVRDSETAARLRTLANNGMTAIAWHRYGRSAVPSPPQVVEPGFKYRMHDVSAAIGLEQLAKLDRFLQQRRRLARMYRTVLADVDEVALPAVPEYAEHAWHLLIVRLKLDRLTKTRDEIAQDLRRENVGTGVHFLGLHLHQYYAKTLGIDPADLPEATAASYDILSLPLYPQMTDKNVGEVVDALKKVLAHAIRKP